MRLSRLSITVVVLGLVLVVLSPLWKWVIGPRFVRLPTTLVTTSDYVATLTVFADRDSMKLYPAGQEKKQRLRISSVDRAIPSKSDSHVVVFKETTSVRDADTGKPLADTGGVKYVALDRKTALNVSGHSSDRHREGLCIFFPPGTEKKEYPWWDDDTGSTTQVTFQKEIKLDGDKHKNVSVYEFKSEGATLKMVNPPMGLPKEVTGSMAKKITGMATLQIPDGVMLQIDYRKKVNATVIAEPKTGAVVDVPSFHQEYLVNVSPIGPPNYRTLATLDYAQEKSNVSKVLDRTASYFWLLEMNSVWLPLILLVVGLILAVTGLFLGRRPRRAS